MLAVWLLMMLPLICIGFADEWAFDKSQFECVSEANPMTVGGCIDIDTQIESVDIQKLKFLMRMPVQA